MRRRVVILTLLSSIIIAASVTNAAVQTPPDNDVILRAIVDSDSPYYYPRIMMRYEMGDTTLTVADYHYLYYGYAYQDAYKPLETVKGESELLMVLEQGDTPSQERAHELIKYAIQVMEADPFSPKNLNFLTFAYGIVGDTLNELINADRLHKVLAVIESSGTGLKEKEPRHVLWFSHAADFLASKGLDIQRRTVRTRTVEYIALKERDGNVKGYFFDFGRVYWRRPENVVRERRVSGFEINGMKVGRRKSLYSPAR